MEGSVVPVPDPAPSVATAVMSELGPLAALSPVCDASGRIVDFRFDFLNQAARTLIGDNSDLLVGATLLDSFPTHGNNGLFGAYKKVMTSGEQFFREVFLDDGELRGWFEVRASRHDGMLLVMTQDITARRIAEEAAKEHSAILQATVDSLLDPHILLGAVRDAAGTIVDFVFLDANRKACEYNTMTRNELVGSSLLELLPGHAPSGLLAMYARVIETGEPLSLKDYCYPQELMLGTERRYDIIAVKVGDNLSYTWRDVTDRYNAAQALLLSESHYRLLAENSSDVVFLIDHDRTCQWVSSSVTGILGWEPEELIGRSPKDFIHPDDIPAATTARMRVLEGGVAAAVLNVRLRTKTGDYRWMRGRPRPMLDDAGKLLGAIVGLYDATETVQAEMARDRSEELLRSVLDASPNQILQYDKNHRVEYVNDAVACVAGVPKELCIGRTPQELGFPAVLATEFCEHIDRVFEEGVGHVFEMKHDPGDGHQYFEVTISPVFDASGSVVRVMSDTSNITGRHKAEHELTLRATRDGLTGLANRDMLLDELDRAIAASHRSDSCVGLLMIDLDNFKRVNDTLGHDAGDQMLVAAAGRFSATVRAGDLVARLGGDEFVVVLRDVADLDAAFRQAQRLVKAFHEPLRVGTRELNATVSVGSTVSSPSSTSADLLREADAALYKAKEEGRNRAVVLDSRLRTAVYKRHHVETELRAALSNNQFAVWYQPQVNMVTGEILAVEALLRWHHPSDMILTADQFLGIAEESGLAAELCDWALARACTQVADWNARPGAHKLGLNVNISAAQFAAVDFVDTVRNLLNRSGLDPALLCIEAAEKTLLASTPGSQDNLARLTKLGVHLALDNFGTGYTSLASLRGMHHDVAKLDRSFVHAAVSDSYDRQLIAGILAIAAHTGVTVVATGVETQEQADVMMALGCTVAQGFLYSPAVPADKLEDIIRQGNFSTS